MPDASWKQAERHAATVFGTVRTPLSGGNGGVTRSDTFHPRLFVEVKRRRRFPVVALFHEVADLARREGKIPVVVLAAHRRRNLFAVVPLDRDYLLALAGEIVATPPVPKPPPVGGKEPQ